MESFLLVVGILAFIAIIVLVAVRIAQNSKRGPQTPSQVLTQDPPPAPLLEFDNPTQLKVGDFMDVRGATFQVVGKVRLEEDGEVWHEFFMTAVDNNIPFLDRPDQTELWISVETVPVLKVMQWSALPDSALDGLTPGEKTVTHGGEIFTRTEQGSAEFVTEGATDMPSRGTVRYIDYQGAGEVGTALSFEQYAPSGWEVSLGSPLPPGLFKIYPARGPA